MFGKYRFAAIWGTTLMVLVSLLGACGATTSPTTQPTTAAQSTKPAATATQPTPSPATAPAAGPKVGGTLHVAIEQMIETLDPHKTATALGVEWTGSTLIAYGPDGKFYPYLAEKWTSSKDGLTWDFTLRRDVKFQDGAPFTAQDYVYTFDRIKDPATKTAGAAEILDVADSWEAVDAYTLRITLKEPYFSFFNMLTFPRFQPVSKTSVERLGDRFAQYPIGVGPWKVKEFVTGQKVVFERNADYSWNPGYATRIGAPYIQVLEARFIPEAATVVAGLQSGEIDIAKGIDPKDVSFLKGLGTVQIAEGYYWMYFPGLFLNVAKWPLDDVRVRQALNAAVDRQVLCDVALSGQAVPMTGPLTPSQQGYWPGQEAIGYRYDVNKAKALLKEAGFTAGSGGVLQKDGKPLRIEVEVATGFPQWAQALEIVKEQYAAVGIDLELALLDMGIMDEHFFAGDSQAMVDAWEASDARWGLYNYYHSSQLGVYNLAHVTDPTLDALLNSVKAEMDPAKNEEAIIASVKRVIEQAYSVPLFSAKRFAIVNNRVKGWIFPVDSEFIFLDDAYIVQ